MNDPNPILQALIGGFLWGGGPDKSFTAPYEATSRSGVTVRGQCCWAGHITPKLAAEHAAQVAAEIRMLD